MGRALQLPGFDELPAGERREFAAELFDYYRRARRPRLADIEQRIQVDETLAGFASRETIRKVLTGKTVPSNWENVYALFKALCDLAAIEVDSTRITGNSDSFDRSRTEHLEDLWNKAIDAPRAPGQQLTATHVHSTSPDPDALASASITTLTEREREVAQLIVQGRTFEEIGATLFISPNTVKHHVQRMSLRLGVTNRTDLHARLRRALS